MGMDIQKSMNVKSEWDCQKGLEQAGSHFTN